MYLLFDLCMGFDSILAPRVGILGNVIQLERDAIRWREIWALRLLAPPFLKWEEMYMGQGSRSEISAPVTRYLDLVLA